jgi:hypothetical protein
MSALPPLFLAAVFSMVPTGALLATDRLNVSVCNQGHLSESFIARAESEVEFIFRSMEIQVVWARCQEEITTEQAIPGLRFIIRLRSDDPPKTSGQASLDAMGRAFASAQGEGYLADIYDKGVRRFAEVYQTDSDGLFGCVIAHELGHLLLGPGHSPQGIMRARWVSNDALAVKQRWLKFTMAERTRIRRSLQVRNSAQTVSR